MIDPRSAPRGGLTTWCPVCPGTEGVSAVSVNVSTVNPWNDDDSRPTEPEAWDHAKRPRPGWGCAVAAIIASVAAVVAVIIVVKFLASLINPGDLSP